MTKECKGGDGSLIGCKIEFLSVTNEFGVTHTAEELRKAETERLAAVDKLINPPIGEMGVFMQDINGHYYGLPDGSRLKAAKWWQRLGAFFSKAYKRSFMDIKPLPMADFESRKNELIKIEY